VALHKSLRRKSRLIRQRSVYSREERIGLLKADEKWVEGQSPTGLPKQRVFRATVGKKKKKEKKEEEVAGKGGKAAKGAAPAAKAGAKK
jgi:small basic protein (TIGR04137 family)